MRCIRFSAKMRSRQRYSLLSLGIQKCARFAIEKDKTRGDGTASPFRKYLEKLLFSVKRFKLKML